MAHDTPVKGSVSRDIKKKVDVGEGKKYLTCREKKKKKRSVLLHKDISSVKPALGIWKLVHDLYSSL